MSDELEPVRRLIVPEFTEEQVRYLDERMEAARWKPDSPLAQQRVGPRRPADFYERLRPGPHNTNVHK